MLGSLLTGFVIGLIATAVTHRGEQLGCFVKSLLGIVGAWLGQTLFGYWGPQLGGTAILPAILGAVLFLAIFVARRD